MSEAEMSATKEMQEQARQRVRQALRQRREAGATPTQIGQALGVSPITVWKWANGRLPDAHLGLVALMLGIDGLPVEEDERGALAA